MVLDTGIDKDHPALRDNFEKGRDFTGEEGAPYPFVDLVGHGTHCAGTIAGVRMGSGFSGVAPKAKILAGRVCGERGCSSIAVAAGMNWAITEKVDLISMSLGGTKPTGIERRAVEAVDKAGITIVAASGNDGVPKVGFPAAFAPVVAVGAIDSTLAKAKFSQWGPELALVAPGVDVVSSVPVGSGREAKVDLNQKTVLSTSFSGSPEIAEAVSNDLVVSGLGKPENFSSAVKGKFALIRRGEIPFADKVKNAIAAGALGAVIYNNEPGLMQGALTQDGSTVAIPVVMIEQSSGLQAEALIAQGMAVRATVQTMSTDYAAFAGTSMATPHVAGVVALMKTANKNLTPAEVKNILKSTATATAASNTENEYGSGLLNAEKAVQAAEAMVVPVPEPNPGLAL
jgi:serine protease